MENQSFLHHVGFVVSDLDRSVEFYVKNFEFSLYDRWKETPDMCEMGFGVPGAYLELAQLTGHGFNLELYQFLEGVGPRAPIVPNHVGLGHFSLAVEDFNGLIEGLKANGVRLASEIVKLKTGQWVHVLDPDGTRIEVMGRL